MDNCQNRNLGVQFDHRLKLNFLGTKITNDEGLLAYPELDEAFRLTEMADDAVEDSRVGKNKQHGIVPLLRQSIYSRLAGYEDVNDAERLSIDPTIVTRCWRQSKSAGPASCFQQRDRSVRDRDPQHKEQSQEADRLFRQLDRPDSPTTATQGADPRTGQLGERDIWRAGRLGLQRPLRLYLLPPVVSVPPVWRPGTCHAAAW